MQVSVDIFLDNDLVTFECFWIDDLAGNKPYLHGIFIHITVLDDNSIHKHSQQIIRSSSAKILLNQVVRIINQGSHTLLQYKSYPC